MSAGWGAGVQTWAQRGETVRRAEGCSRCTRRSAPLGRQAGRAGGCPGEGLHSRGPGPVSAQPQTATALLTPASLKQGKGTQQDAGSLFRSGHDMMSLVCCVVQSLETPFTDTLVALPGTPGTGRTGHASPGCPPSLPQTRQQASSAAPVPSHALRPPPPGSASGGGQGGPRAGQGRPCLSTGRPGLRPRPSSSHAQLLSSQMSAQHPPNQSQPLRVQGQDPHLLWKQ